MNFLKNNVALGILTLLIATASCSFTNTMDPGDKNKEELLLYIISTVLQRNHFAPANLNDTFSKEVFDNYIDELDPAKRYFLQKDYDEFAVYKDQIDDQIRNGDVSLFNITYERLLQRQEESKKIFEEVINKPIDFNINESMSTDYEKMPYAKNKSDLKEHWRKLLKLAALNGYYDRMQENDSLSADKKKTPATIEKEAREEVKKTIAENFKLSSDVTRLDYFSVFINAITAHFDPHTNYFAPENKERFDQSMSGKLEGIGARLQKTSENIKVVELISGGPAWRSEKLEVGDVILKVAQQGDKIATSIGGMSIAEAVKLIKGPKGTEVTLTIKKVDGRSQDITLERDIVLIEETFAKSIIVKDNDVNYGFINLPTFYFDQESAKGRAAGDDIAIEIERLKAAGAEGLVLDLRDNGGGSLREVIEMVGHFIPSGPVVQVALKNSKTPQTLRDNDGGKTLWDGPLVIMVNELSASASEILAAALQDYDRAVIIGSKQTFGKGTVQNLEDLNGFVRNNEHGELGAIKLTTQKFYRINGSSTQLQGVKSDVITPDRYSYIEIGERDEDFPLPYDEIAPVSYNKFTGYTNLKETIAASNNRINENATFKLIDENAQWLNKQRDENTVPLSYEGYKNRIAQLESQTDKYKVLEKFENNLNFVLLANDIEAIKSDKSLGEKRDRWKKGLKKDIYLEEAINVLKSLRMNNSGLGKRN